MLSLTSTSLQAKQLISNTTSIFFIGWEMQHDKDGCSYRQLVIGRFFMTMPPVMHCAGSCAEIFGETSNYPGDSASLQSRNGILWLLAFPKTKIAFEREEISDNWWDSEKYDGAADGDWGNLRSPKVPTMKGMEALLFYVQCFLYLVSSINVSISQSIWLDTFWTDLLCVHVCINNR